jgi:hypothetical protein
VKQRILALLLISLSLFACVLFGVVLGFLSHVIYIIVLFPLGLGFMVALVFWIALQMSDIQGLTKAYLAAAVGLCVAYGCMHYTMYQLFMHTVVAQAIAKEVHHPEAVQRIQQMIEQRFRFSDFMQARADAGITLFTLPIQGWWFYLFLLADSLIAFGAAVVAIRFFQADRQSVF